MRTLGSVLRLARADFAERSRRFSFLVMLATSLYAGYGFLPPAQANYVTLRFGDHRGIYNSAWVGAAIAMLTAAFLGLIGFYLIKNAIDRDRQTRVGQILAAAPLSRFQYILSKMFSNFAVLAAIALAVATSAGVTQLVRGEDTTLRLGKLLAPYLVLTLPSLLVIAAIAVLFECVPGLRGGGGNVAYFFLWGLGMGASSAALRASGADYLGFGLLLPSMMEACHAAFPDYDPGLHNMALGLNFRAEGVWTLTTFVWNGTHFTPRMIALRGIWVALAVGATWLAARVFDRFSGDTGGGRRRRADSQSERGGDAEAAPGFAEHLGLTALSLTPPRGLSVAHFLRLLAAEIRLLAKGTSRWWYVVMIGLWIASAVTPLALAQLHVLPLVWLWPVLLWSSMGVREARFGMDQILFSSPHPLRLQIPAAWLGGVAVALLSGCVIGARLLFAGDVPAVLAWLVGACFVPALALALGVWTGSSRAFEGIYTALWYMGPLQPIPAIDFMGASQAAIAAGTPGVFALVTIVLLVLCFLGRQRRLQN
jgi:hypothetical protein